MFPPIVSLLGCNTIAGSVLTPCAQISPAGMLFTKRPCGWTGEGEGEKTGWPGS